MRSGRHTLAMALSALLLLMAGWLGAAPLYARPEAPSAVGWVGSMSPVGGSTNSLEVGSAGGFDVYVQVWKSGVTEAPGPGAGIQCFLNWGPSGGPRSDQAMVFNVQIGNNDEYRATIATASLPIGSYAFSAYCTDDGGATKTWQGAGDGFLVITPPQARALWIDEATIAWDTSHGPGGGVTYRLHYTPDGSLNLPAVPGSSILLSYDSILTASSYPKFPNANGYKALKLSAGDLALLPDILKGEIAIAAYNSGGTLLGAGAGLLLLAANRLLTAPAKPAIPQPEPAPRWQPGPVPRTRLEPTLAFSTSSEAWIQNRAGKRVEDQTTADLRLPQHHHAARR